jgi:hypothetical protein
VQQPKYRHYKPKNLAVVRIKGRDHYLGKYNSPESWEKYHRLLAEGGAAPPVADAAGARVDEVILAFMKSHHSHYRRADGTETGELGNFRDSLQPLKGLYGSTLAKDFSPKALKAVRQTMIESGLARGTINQRIGRIVHVFKWSVSEELVPPTVHRGLKSVSGLQKDRSAARETAPIKPVAYGIVDAIQPHVLRQAWTMIQLQRLTGMRPGEVVLICARAFRHPTISAIKAKNRTPEQEAELKGWDRAHAWHPNQLRHSMGTQLRREFDLETARAVLGHCRMLGGLKPSPLGEWH